MTMKEWLGELDAAVRELVPMYCTFLILMLGVVGVFQLHDTRTELAEYNQHRSDYDAELQHLEAELETLKQQFKAAPSTTGLDDLGEERAQMAKDRRDNS